MKYELEVIVTFYCSIYQHICGGSMKAMRESHQGSIGQKRPKKVVPKQCTLCGIILNVPCLNPHCPGHHNASTGDICAYCATNQREKRLHVPASHGLLQSSLDDVSADMDDRVEVEVDWEVT